MKKFIDNIIYFLKCAFVYGGVCAICAFGFIGAMWAINGMMF